MDNRERYLQEIGDKLATLIDDDEKFTKVFAVITIGLEKYELTERTTEVGFADGSTDRLLQLYAGTLLTEGKSKKTVRGYVLFLKKFASEISKNLVEVTTMDIRIWLAKKQTEISLRSCENYRAYLSSFYSWLINEEYIAKNPMAKIKPVKYIEKERAALSDVEIDAIRIATDNNRDRAMFELLLSSGIRVAELCALNKKDIDFSKKSVHVRTAKGGKQRISYINDITAIYLKKYLKQRNDDNESLFITRNKTRMTTDAARGCLKKLGEQSGVEDVHPHRCRRTFATSMYKKGMDIHSIQRLLGHSDINTTMLYIQEDEQAIKAEYRKYA